MPCYRCGTRQVDPDRGESPWKRGVRDDRQVLVCPGCQAAFDWAADLDRCAVCSSLRLVRRLGEVECRDCGAIRQSATASVPGHLARMPSRAEITAEPAAVDDLAAEVERALARVLGRTAGSAAGG
jgi:hypothetical protein